jgi:hypothetical protein
MIMMLGCSGSNQLQISYNEKMDRGSSMQSKQRVVLVGLYLGVLCFGAQARGGEQEFAGKADLYVGQLYTQIMGRDGLMVRIEKTRAEPLTQELLPILNSVTVRAQVVLSYLGSYLHCYEKIKMQQSVEDFSCVKEFEGLHTMIQHFKNSYSSGNFNKYLEHSKSSSQLNTIDAAVDAVKSSVGELEQLMNFHNPSKVLASQSSGHCSSGEAPFPVQEKSAAEALQVIGHPPARYQFTDVQGKFRMFQMRTVAGDGDCAFHAMQAALPSRLPLINRREFHRKMMEALNSRDPETLNLVEAIYVTNELRNGRYEILDKPPGTVARDLDLYLQKRTNDLDQASTRDCSSVCARAGFEAFIQCAGTSCYWLTHDAIKLAAKLFKMNVVILRPKLGGQSDELEYALGPKNSVIPGASGSALAPFRYIRYNGVNHFDALVQVQ